MVHFVWGVFGVLGKTGWVGTRRPWIMSVFMCMGVYGLFGVFGGKTAGGWGT